MRALLFFMLITILTSCYDKIKILPGPEPPVQAQIDTIFISTAAQLDNVRNNLSGYYKLVTNIDLTDYLSIDSPGNPDGFGWQPIGDIQRHFAGTFDGNGYTITGLTIDRTSYYYVGLFAYISNATIKNLGVEISPNGLFGGYFTGGLIGYAYNSTITGCYSKGDVAGVGSWVGGLIGFITTSELINSYAVGNVLGFSSLAVVGGLVGGCNAVIENCYAAGTVNSFYAAGGLVGALNMGSMNNCVSLSQSVKGNAFVGRVAGVLGMSGTLINNGARSDMEVIMDNEFKTVINNSGNIDGESFIATALQQKSTYEDMGWDFTTVWTIDEGNGYPSLQRRP